jgi:hypothetical protein
MTQIRQAVERFLCTKYGCKPKEIKLTPNPTLEELLFPHYCVYCGRKGSYTLASTNDPNSQDHAYKP